MDLFEAIEQRASVRQFAPVAVPRADIQRILNAGRHAPSGNNAQPVRYIVVTERDTLDKLGVAQACIAEASAAIVVAADPTESDYWVEDASAATQNMLLAIEALGYGSVWIQGTLRKHMATVREALGVPAGIEVLIVLPIGKPTQPVPPREKKPLSELVHDERW